MSAISENFKEEVKERIISMGDSIEYYSAEISKDENKIKEHRDRIQATEVALRKMERLNEPNETPRPGAKRYGGVPTANDFGPDGTSRPGETPEAKPKWRNIDLKQKTQELKAKESKMKVRDMIRAQREYERLQKEIEAIQKFEKDLDSIAEAIMPRTQGVDYHPGGIFDLYSDVIEKMIPELIADLRKKRNELEV